MNCPKCNKNMDREKKEKLVLYRCKCGIWFDSIESEDTNIYFEEKLEKSVILRRYGLGGENGN